MGWMPSGVLAYILKAVSANHSGDSDSTAAITGQLIGAQIGLSGIRRTWPDIDHVYGDLDLKTATDMILSRFQNAALI